jgi:Mn-dependent DtxR family transcriptional regulator
MNKKIERDINSIPADISSLKMQFLFCLLNMEDRSKSITHISKVLGVSKATISRIKDWGEANNILIYDQTHKPVLTKYGMRLAQRYEFRKEIATKWLSSERVPSPALEKDAMNFSMFMSAETVAVIERIVKRAEVRKEIGSKPTIDGRNFCAMLGDGVYTITFMFFRYMYGNAFTIEPSMANIGLESDAELIVTKGVGTIRLRAKPIKHASAMSGEFVSGSLSTLKYKENDLFREARKEGNDFFFPADVLQIVKIGDKNDVLQGNAILKMSCSAGSMHMPESVSLFTMFF